MTPLSRIAYDILSAAQDAAAEVRRDSLAALDTGDHTAAAAALPDWERAQSQVARAAEVYSDALAREIGQLAGFAHMTELEKLWVTHDPEYPQYRKAFDDLRAASAKRTTRYFLVERLPMWLPHDDTPFHVDSVDSWAAAYAAFRSKSDVLAIAHRGHIVACKK
ncbi:MAG: hypothetical protein IPM16_06625 [Chloroflexi bacterium]|nr:hypothetical protein [Chloroflexota bacterium]